MIVESDIVYQLQRNFIDYDNEDVTRIKESLEVGNLRIEDIQFQIDSADNVQDVIDIINAN